MAARGGHLPVVEWLGKSNKEGGTSCTKHAMDWAIERGHLSIVEWLRCNQHEDELDFIDYTPSALTIAAKRGYVTTLEWMAAHDLPKEDYGSIQDKMFDEEKWRLEALREDEEQVLHALGKCHLQVVKKWILSNALSHVSNKYQLG